MFARFPAADTSSDADRRTAFTAKETKARPVLRGQRHQPGAPPARGEKPGGGRKGRRPRPPACALALARVHAPPVEEGTGGEGIDPPSVTAIGGVMYAIVDHIDQHGADHARRREHARVITLRAERPPTAPHERVDLTREAYLEPLDSASERTAIGGLDYEVYMIVLHGEVRDSNQTAGVRLAQRALDEGEPAL